MTSKSNLTRGQVFVIAAASGTGKTSLVSALLSAHANAAVSISHTTRAQRPNEQDGINYFFVDRARFETLIQQGLFVEHAEVFGNLYGTSTAEVERIIAAGKQLILEIDWQGAQQVKAKLPDANLIFILPPTLETLKSRLLGRGQDDLDTVEQRFKGARDEIAQYHTFDYLIVNDDFQLALQQLSAIVFEDPTPFEIKAQAARHADLLAALTT